jgi:threonine aldolase
MSDIRIELTSDTKTRPSAAMLKAMTEAELGDEQTGDDPTTNALNDAVAELLGKEAAVFLPSGTMCNEIALAVHCRPGDEVVCDATAHIYGFESGGPAAIAGISVRPVDGDAGVFTAAQVEAAIRPAIRHAPITRLVSVEQTVNMGGGTVWPLETLNSVVQFARERGFALHMDGARLLNAVVASGVPAKDFAAGMDTVWIDLSKGLGCPVGGVLAGTKDFVAEAWRWKQRLGGAMRQSGVLAAAGLYALEHNVDRLADDHANARLFAELIADVPGIEVAPDQVPTNIVVFAVAPGTVAAPDLSARLRARGIGLGALSATQLRAVTHLDVDEAGVREAAGAIKEILADV